MMQATQTGDPASPASGGSRLALPGTSADRTSRPRRERSGHEGQALAGMPPHICLPPLRRSRGGLRQITIRAALDAGTASTTTISAAWWLLTCLENRATMAAGSPLRRK